MLAEQSKRKWFTLRNTSCLSRIEFDRSSCWSAVLQFYVHRKDNKRLSLTPILSQIQVFQWEWKSQPWWCFKTQRRLRVENPWTLTMCWPQFRDDRTDGSVNGKSELIFSFIPYLNWVGSGTPSTWSIEDSCRLWGASRKQTLCRNWTHVKFVPDSKMHHRLASHPQQISRGWQSCCCFFS